MTSMSEQGVDGLAFSDDELVAVALRNSAMWSSPLPTLVEADVDVLANAAARGWRSLNVRGFVSDGALVAEVDRWLRPALDQRTALRSFIVDGADEVIAVGISTSCYITDDSAWIVEVVTPDGVHQFNSTNRSRSIALYEQALRDVYRDGLEVPPEWPTDMAEPNALCLAVIESDGVSVVQVRRGEVSIVRPPDAAVESVAEVGAALAEFVLLRPDLGDSVR